MVRVLKKKILIRAGIPRFRQIEVRETAKAKGLLWDHKDGKWIRTSICLVNKLIIDQSRITEEETDKTFSEV